MAFMRKALLLAVVCAHIGFAAGNEAVTLKWSDAARLIQGKQVAVALSSGGVRKGLVTNVDSESIAFEKGKPAQVNRQDVKEIKLIDYQGDGRRFGKLLGGAVGLLGGIIGGAAVGMNEVSAHKERDKVVAATLIIGGLPAGLAAGYYLGRRADREVTIIRIIPE